MSTWQEIPWLELAIFGFLAVLFIYGLMRANYEAYRKIEKEKKAREKQLATNGRRRDSCKANPPSGI